MKTLAIVGSSLPGLPAARTACAEGSMAGSSWSATGPTAPTNRPPLSKDFLSGKIAPDALRPEDDEEDLAAYWEDPVEKLSSAPARLSPSGAAMSSAPSAPAARRHTVRPPNLAPPAATILTFPLSSATE